MNVNKLKKNSALSAIDYVYFKSILGIGSGTTIKYFLKELKKKNILGTVSSSRSSSFLLKKYNIPELYLNDILCKPLCLYIDGADEVNFFLEMIKGGGAALTKEKIICSKAKKFICIVDEYKVVDQLGSFPLPVEIIPMAYKFLKYKFKKLGGYPKLRENYLTENGNIIIDIFNLPIKNPNIMEKKINSIPGVITVGIFSFRKADLILIGTKNGIKIIKKI